MWVWCLGCEWFQSGEWVSVCVLCSEEKHCEGKRPSYLFQILLFRTATLPIDYLMKIQFVFLIENIVQIWQMRTGPRLRTISCSKGSKMLQPSYRFGASMSSPYVPLEVFLLNGDSGQISILNRTLDSWQASVIFFFFLSHIENYFCKKKKKKN